MNLYLIGGAVALILAGWMKYKSIVENKLRSQLLTKDAEIKDEGLKTKQEEISKDLETLKENRDKAIDDSKDESAESFWKKKLK